MADQDHIGENLRRYMDGFSEDVRDIFERFEFHTQIDRLEKARLLSRWSIGSSSATGPLSWNYAPLRSAVTTRR